MQGRELAATFAASNRGGVAVSTRQALAQNTDDSATQQPVSWHRHLCGPLVPVRQLRPLRPGHHAPRPGPGPLPPPASTTRAAPVSNDVPLFAHSSALFRQHLRTAPPFILTGGLEESTPPPQNDPSGNPPLHVGVMGRFVTTLAEH